METLFLYIFGHSYYFCHPVYVNTVFYLLSLSLSILCNRLAIREKKPDKEEGGGDDDRFDSPAAKKNQIYNQGR